MLLQHLENRTLSPYTGYTREHWRAVADSLLAAVVPYSTADGALYHLPGRTSWSGSLSDGLEGYARTLLLAAFRRDKKTLDRYADGLAAGTAGVWPRIEDRSQPLVEAASIALALRLTRPLLWDRLDEAVQQRAVAWLSDALRAKPWPCNWELFPMTVGGFLESIGYEPKASREAIARGLNSIEQWYVSNGWYTDGAGRAFDHYNGWAMNFYPVLHAWLAEDARLLDFYGARLRSYLADYVRLFGSDGGPMHQGRSLIYRFATTAPLWLGALVGYTPLTPGETRRLASGTLRYFLDRGAVDERGLLTLGWHGPDESVLQDYSGPASPYWASKAFIALLLSPDHQAWTEKEEAGPTERADAVTPLLAPNWLLQSTKSDGLVRLHNHGSEKAGWEPYYNRFAYSTATQPSTRDNTLMIGNDPSRNAIEPLGVGNCWAASRHTTAGGVKVTSLIVAKGATEVRAHLVAGAAPGTPVRVTGWQATNGLRAELLPVLELSGSGETLIGATGDGATLFVALARLTREPDPLQLRELAYVEVERPCDLCVSFDGHDRARFRFSGPGWQCANPLWSVAPF